MINAEMCLLRGRAFYVERVTERDWRAVVDARAHLKHYETPVRKEAFNRAVSAWKRARTEAERDFDRACELPGQIRRRAP